MNALINFQYQGVQVRTQRDGAGEPLFCLADICKVLDGNQPNKVAEAIREEFGRTELNSAHPEQSSDSLITIPTDTGYGVKDMIYITEPQLYFVLFRSRSELAKPFRRWVDSEVLPTIRKTGSYSTNSAQGPISLERQVYLAKMLLDTAGIKGNQMVLSLDRLVKAKTGESLLALTGTQLEAPQPKQLLTPTQLGQSKGLSGIKVNKRIAELGYQVKTEAGWEPTPLGLSKGAVMQDTGKKHGNGTPVRQLKWPSDLEI